MIFLARFVFVFLFVLMMRVRFLRTLYAVLHTFLGMVDIKFIWQLFAAPRFPFVNYLRPLCIYF